MLLSFYPLFEVTSQADRSPPFSALLARAPLAGSFMPVSPGDMRVFGIDFSRLLASGDSIVSVVSAISVYVGTDAGASALAVGDSFMVGNVACQWIGAFPASNNFFQQGAAGFQPGVTYRWLVAASTVNHMTLIAYAHIPVLQIS